MGTAKNKYHTKIKPLHLNWIECGASSDQPFKDFEYTYMFTNPTQTFSSSSAYVCAGKSLCMVKSSCSQRGEPGHNENGVQCVIVIFEWSGTISKRKFCMQNTENKGWKTCCTSFLNPLCTLKYRWATECHAVVVWKCTVYPIFQENCHAVVHPSALGTSLFTWAHTISNRLLRQ